MVNVGVVSKCDFPVEPNKHSSQLFLGPAGNLAHGTSKRGVVNPRVRVIRVQKMSERNVPQCTLLTMIKFTTTKEKPGVAATNVNLRALCVRESKAVRSFG